MNVLAKRVRQNPRYRSDARGQGDLPMTILAHRLRMAPWEAALPNLVRPCQRANAMHELAGVVRAGRADPLWAGPS